MEAGVPQQRGQNSHRRLRRRQQTLCLNVGQKKMARGIGEGRIEGRDVFDGNRERDGERTVGLAQVHPIFCLRSNVLREREVFSRLFWAILFPLGPFR